MYDDDRDELALKMTANGIIALVVMVFSLAAIVAIIYFTLADKPADFPVPGPTTVIMPIESQPAPAPVIVPTPAPIVVQSAPVVTPEPSKPEVKPEVVETPVPEVTTTTKE